eukprot:3158780-Alexandrium_andersonii.AAC.1
MAVEQEGEGPADPLAARARVWVNGLPPPIDHVLVDLAREGHERLGLLQGPVSYTHLRAHETSAHL